MAGTTRVNKPRSSEAREWISGLAEALEMPWEWKSPEVLHIGPGEPWVAVLVQFDATGEWRSIWFERSPRSAIQRGSVGEMSTPRIVHGLKVDMSASLEWNSWLSWFEQRHGLDDSIPDWVVQGLVRRSWRREGDSRSASSSRQGANYRRAAQKAQEVLVAKHAAEYQELLDQFLVVEALSP